ncbi:MAG: T9SS type A sorting domain-containing protein [candidate division WOR-3 bacterium]
MLYKSTDGGSVWSAVDGFYDDGGAVVLDPNNSSVVYYGGYFLASPSWMIISKSTNGGATWKRDSLTTASNGCGAIAVDRNNSNVVYVGGNNAQLFKTTNGGITWTSSNTGISGAVYDIKITQGNSNIVYAGTSSGVFKSTDAGANWISTGLSANVQAIIINPSNENEIYAAATSGVYKSTSGGGGWTLMNSGLWITNATSLGIHPSNWLFCGTNGSGMYRWSLQVGIEELKQEVKKLLQIVPNPLRNSCVIYFHLPGDNEPQEINLAIYDVTGKIVKSFKPLILDNQVKTLRFTWDVTDDKGRAITPGVYFARVNNGINPETTKLIVLK